MNVIDTGNYSNQWGKRATGLAELTLPNQRKKKKKISDQRRILVKKELMEKG
jgi:hypothetical protein